MTVPEFNCVQLFKVSVAAQDIKSVNGPLYDDLAKVNRKCINQPACLNDCRVYTAMIATVAIFTVTVNGDYSISFVNEHTETYPNILNEYDCIKEHKGNNTSGCVKLKQSLSRYRFNCERPPQIVYA